LARLYLPVTRDGKAEHLIIDSGTARTWFRMDQGAAEWKDDAFVATIGNAKLHVLGRKVPAFKEQVRGHSPVGALGNDLLVDGFTELDLARGRLLRHTSISPELLAWPTLPFTIDRGIMYARVPMDGKERLLQIDTGAPNSMLITPAHTNNDARFDRTSAWRSTRRDLGPFRAGQTPHHHRRTRWRAPPEALQHVLKPP